MQLLDHGAELTSRACAFSSLPFPPPVPPEVIVDRRHGWVMSALSLGDQGVVL